MVELLATVASPNRHVREPEEGRTGELPAEQVAEMMERARTGEELTVDLEARTAGGFPFELDDFTRACLLEGLDEVGLTLRDEDALAAYEAAHPAPISTLATA